MENKEDWRTVLDVDNVQRVIARLIKEQGEDEKWPESDKKLAAVLIPMVTVEGEPSVLFTLRSRELSHHRNQVSFPGGMADTGDTSPTDTALRETEEELGISPSDVEVWGRLPSIPGRNLSSLITPILGRVKQLDLDSLAINRAEVEEVFTLPLRHLACHGNQRYTQFKMGRGFPSYYSPVFSGGPHRVWGFTAFILDMALLRLAPGKYTSALSRTLTRTLKQ